MERITLVCDACGAEQRQENHWWVVFLEGSGWHWVLVPLQRYRDGGREAVTGQKVQHLCGAECVTRRVSEFMSGFLEGAPK